MSGRGEMEWKANSAGLKEWGVERGGQECRILRCIGGSLIKTSEERKDVEQKFALC